MSRVLLLASSPSEITNTFFPYALLFLRSALRKSGHQVSIVDFQLGAEAFALFKEELLKKPDVLGVSLICGPGVGLARKASRLCRQLSPRTTIVWGGILPTISPEMVFEEESVDYIIRFDAEDSFPLFVDALEQGAIPGNLRNLAYREGDKIVVQDPPTECGDLSNFLPIDFTSVTSEKYISTHMHLGRRVSSIFTSRGCPYNCTFCYNLYFNQRRWRPFPEEWVLDTVDKLVDTFRTDALLVFDDNLFVDPERVRRILEKVKSKGHRINWYGELRVDQVLKLSVEELREFYALGMVLVYIGVESGCDRILKLFNKQITSEQAREANRKLAQTGISPCYTFVVGAPTETAKETIETVDLAMELLRENPRASIWQFNQYTPYPGTPLYKLAIRNGFKPYENLQDWDVGWTVRDQNISETTFGPSEMATLRYAALFQKPDFYISSRSFTYRSAYKTLRRVFRERMRRHLFAPSIDTWAVGAVYEGILALNQYRMARIRGEL